MFVEKAILLETGFERRLGAIMSTHADCRMYESKYPDVDDVVMVQVKSIAEMGAYVSLLEYNGIEGMILLSELSRRRIRSITKLIKVWVLMCFLGKATRPDEYLCSHQHSLLQQAAQLEHVNTAKRRDK